MMSIQQRVAFDDGFDLDVDLNVSEGVTAVFGPSGCGKTTLLRCIAGLEPAARGHIQIGELSWQGEAAREPTHRRGVGYVFQDAHLFDHLTVAQNIDYAVRRASGEQTIERASLVETLNLDALLGRHPARLSGGERQRVAIARALMSQPRVLLMDEPLAALDGGLKDEVLPYLERLIVQLAIPVVYVSHSLDELIRLADTLVLMAEGRVRAAGPLSAVLTAAEHQSAFGEEAGVVLAARSLAGPETDSDVLEVSVDGRTVSLLNTLPTPKDVTLRLRVFARDVSIALADHRDTSLLNRLPATIERIEVDAGRALVTLRLDEQRLLARITERSVRQLSLELGQPVWAQIKTVALVR